MKSCKTRLTREGSLVQSQLPAPFEMACTGNCASHFYSYNQEMQVSFFKILTMTLCLFADLVVSDPALFNKHRKLRRKRLDRARLLC